MNLAIYPLTQATLGSAIALVNQVFTYPGFWWERPGFVLWLSVTRNPLAKLMFRFLGLGWARYWVVASDEGNVLGVTGLYTMRKDEDALWLGWTCVHPDARARKIGTHLLNFAISQTQQARISYLRLFTWDGPEAAVARYLYESHGFKLTRTEPLSNYSLLYYELPIADIPPISFQAT